MRGFVLSVPPILVKAFVRRMLHVSQFAESEPHVYRAAYERMALPPPRGVQRIKVMPPVKGEWLVPRRAAKDECLLYLHGGAYCFGSVRTHRELAGRLARLSRRRAFVLDYRLAPEHPFPAAHCDAVHAFQWLVEQGYAPDKITVIGDSAGGNLALSLALGLRARGSRQPGRLVLLSPWTDLTCEGEVDPRMERRDPMIAPDFGKRAAAQYRGAADARDPLLSPAFAELFGLPPMLIHVGSEELLAAEVQAFAARAQASDVSVTLKIWPGMFHVFHAFGSVLEDARRAHRDIARFIDGTERLRSYASHG